MASNIANRKTWVTCYCKGKSITSVFCIIQEYTQSWHSLTCMHDSRDQPSPETVDSSSNHDDDGEKNVATMHNLRLKKKKQQFCTLCTCDFHFRIFHSRSSVINKVKYDQLCSCLDDGARDEYFLPD